MTPSTLEGHNARRRRPATDSGVLHRRRTVGASPLTTSSPAPTDRSPVRRTRPPFPELPTHLETAPASFITFTTDRECNPRPAPPDTSPFTNDQSPRASWRWRSGLLLRPGGQREQQRRDQTGSATNQKSWIVRQEGMGSRTRESYEGKRFRDGRAASARVIDVVLGAWTWWCVGVRLGRSGEFGGQLRG